MPFKILSTVLILSSAACNPQTVNNITQHHVSNPNTNEKSTRGGGTGDGGGGQGILCGNDVSDPKLSGKLMVRDIYEAIYNHRRVMRFDLPKKGGKQVDEDSIKSLVTAIKSYFGPASAHLDFAQEKYWQDFANNISFTPTGSHLIPSSDANSPLAVPNGCEIVQIAYWDESAGPIENGTLYVDQKYWEQLDQFNKIALLAHEYFFKQARKASYKNSDFIRLKVGQLLSKEGLEPLFKDWTPSKDPRVKDILPEYRDGFKYCEGTTDEDPEAYLQLYQYQGKNNEQHIVIPVLKSSNINHSLLHSIQMTFDPSKNYEMVKFTDYMLLAIDDIFLNIFYTELSDKETSEESNDEATDRIQEEIWTNLRYSLSGLLFGKHLYGLYNVTESVQKIVEEMPDHTSKIFQTTIYSNEGPIQISIPGLVNPTLKQKKSKSLNLISPQDLLNKINQTIGKTISQSPSAEKELAILEAISILNNEIDNAINTDKSMKDFPRWLTALKILIDTGDYRIEPDDLNKLTKEFPALLYKCKLTIHTNTKFNFYDELEEAGIDIHNDSEEKKTSKSFNLKRGVIAISKGPHKVEFRLHCKDYINLFQDRTKKETSASTQKPINKNVSVSYQFGQVLEPRDYSYWGKQRFEHYRLKNYHFFKSFMDYLTSGKIETYYDLRELSENECFFRTSNWFPESTPPSRSCQSFSRFYSALVEESKISVIDCYGYGIRFDPNKMIYEQRFISRENAKDKYCAVINFENINDRYIVVFSKPPFDIIENTKNGSQNRDLEPIKNEKYYLPPSIYFVLHIP